VPLSNLGGVLNSQGRTTEAGNAYQRAVEVLEGAVDADHPNLVAIRRKLAGMGSR
jgi:hypothetical protein